MFKILRRALLAFAAAAVAHSAWAAYPERPITLIVPWAPGGSTDILARAIGEQLTKSMGQPIVVDNRAGASGNIGSNLALVANVINTMVVNPSVPAKNLREFIAYAKANPGKLAYASAGGGSTNHLSAEMFKKAAGIDMLHVPYKGGAPAVLATVANETQVLFSAGTQTLPHVKAGKLKLAAVTESKRSKLLPDVPTVAEVLPG
jgi:tripartite-type tricarboxylate transporter receptor subunit TctC